MKRGTTRANLLDCDRRRSAALVSLRSKNHVVVGTQGQTSFSPGVEVVLDGDAAADTVVLADGPVLVEGRGALNRRRVHTSGLVNLVGAAVALDAADLGGAAGGVVVAVTLDNVVLDERVLGPAVEGEVAVAAGVEVAAVGDGPIRNHG